MKKTILTKEIDGVTIVIGMSQLQIDPVQTNANIEGLLEKTEEFAAQKVRKNRASNILKNMSTVRKGVVLIFKNAAARNNVDISEINQKPELLTSNERDQARSADANYARLEKDFDAEMASLKEAARPVRMAKRKIIKDNAVYFGTKQGEKKIKDSDYEAFKPLLIDRDRKNKDPENRKNKIKYFVTLDKRLIPDLTGRKYYFPDIDWTEFVVEKFGDPVDETAVFDYQITAEQEKEVAEFNEAKRISELTVEEKGAEIDLLKDSLLAQASQMRSKAEIEGQTAAKALKASQDWYNAELAKVKTKYGV